MGQLHTLLSVIELHHMLGFGEEQPAFDQQANQADHRCCPEPLAEIAKQRQHEATQSRPSAADEPLARAQTELVGQKVPCECPASSSRTLPSRKPSASLMRCVLRGCFSR